MRGAKRRGNLVDYQYVVRLLRFARNDNIGVLQRSPIIGELMKKNFLDITELIRSIQRAEGNVDCFRRPQGICDRLDCAWRRYCLETQEPVFFEKNGWDEEEC